MQRIVQIAFLSNWFVIHENASFMREIFQSPENNAIDLIPLASPL